MTIDFFHDCVNKYGYCFIAEISNNHLVNIDRYFHLIEAAKASGAHAVKIQTYTPKSLLAPGRAFDRITEGPWTGQTYYSLYNSICAPLHWTKQLFDYARKLDLYIFSSPFSIEDVAVLESVNCPAYKIASFEFTDVLLWDSLCELGKPILASTGIATTKDLELVMTNSSYIKNISVLFNCVSSYPCCLADLQMFKFDLLASYGCLTGLSDHSLNENACVFAYARGARVFEKHLTLKRSDGGPDASFSLEPHELANHIEVLEHCSYSCSNTLNKGLPGYAFGRVVYSKRKINKGEVFSLDNIGNFRPYVAQAVSAIMVKDLFGKCSSRDYIEGEPINVHELANAKSYGYDNK